MDVADIKLDFKCPVCLRRFQVELIPNQVEISVTTEPCPVHLSHTIISMAFACPNCGEKLSLEIVNDEIPDEEDDNVS